MCKGRLQKRKERQLNRGIFLFLLFLFIYVPLKAQVNLNEAFPNLIYTSPLDVQHAGDGSNRLFVVEKEGLIRVFDNNPAVTESKIFLDITDRVDLGGEMGLLGLAFHPDYENNGYFYVNYTTITPELRSIIARYKVSSDPDVADVNSELKLIRLNQPEENHNGGQLAFGPDGYLYSSFGDGGGAGDPNNNAQNRTNLLGTIIRIDVDNPEGDLEYSIPADNPYKNNTLGYRKEIFAYGFRNPWRFSFDTLTGIIWCADVGQAEYEEIDIVISGANYGWPYKEGNHCFRPSENCDIPGLQAPIWEYEHGPGMGSSITGGYVYRGTRIPELYGKYIYSDYVSGNIWALSYDSVNPPQNELLLKAPGNVTSFGVDENNEMYVCVFQSDRNRVYKLGSLTSTGENQDIPADFLLEEAYPNPFNPSTSFRFIVPEPSSIKIEVSNINGEVLTTLANGVIEAGYHQLNWDAGSYTSGIYFIRMTAISNSSAKTYNKSIKVVLLK